jgi:Response regulators consisting of a CheY-like receiver domain and a winged-helix DNA-binding domain
VLLDWNMPKMDGYEFLRALRGCRAATVPRWCSAPPRTTSPTSRVRCMPAPNEYIMKPFDKDIVEAKFQEVGTDLAVPKWFGSQVGGSPNSPSVER